MKIGIFGGSFNPPHQMHINIARDALNMVDKVIFVPVGNAYQKDELIALEDRVQMLKLCLEDRMEVSTIEDKNSQVYTYQTLRYFKEKYPNDQIYFICGSDNIKGIWTWEHASSFIPDTHFLVLLRNQDTKEEVKQIVPHVEFLSINPNSLSSTKIRKSLQQEDYSGLPMGVKEYIKTNHLYQNG